MPATLFPLLVDAVDSWGPTVDAWQYLHWAKGSSADDCERIDGPFDSSELKRTVAGFFDDCPQWITAGIAFGCWKSEKLKPSAGFLHLSIKTWGPMSMKATMGESWIEGTAELVIWRTGPYWARLDGPDTPEKQECNARVAENVHDLVELLACLADRLKPDSIKVFLENGERLPFNAHALYYKDGKQVVADLRNIAAVWADGLPAYHVDPLESGMDGKAGWAFSELRSPEQRRVLWESLTKVMQGPQDFSEERVTECLESGNFDVFRLERGFIVLNYPYCFDAFPDEFLLKSMGIDTA